MQPSDSLIPRLLLHATERPDQPAIASLVGAREWATLSWAELRDAAFALRQRLEKESVGAGARAAASETRNTR